MLGIIIMEIISMGIYKDKLTRNPEGFIRFSLLAWWMNSFTEKFQGNKYVR